MSMPDTDDHSTTSSTALTIPQTRAELEARLRRPQDLYSQFREVLADSIENPLLQKYLAGTSNANSMEGLLGIDDIKAVDIIRETARADGHTLVANAQLRPLKRLLRLARKHGGFTRDQVAMAALAAPQPSDQE